MENCEEEKEEEQVVYEVTEEEGFFLNAHTQTV
jgi:hypothetical protein